MPDYKDLSREQLFELYAHLQENVMLVTAANNELISRLNASPTFANEDRAKLNEWSLALNEIHTASDKEMRRICKIADRASPTAH